MAFGVILIASKVAMAGVISLSVDKRAELDTNNTTAIVTGEVACSDEEMYNVGAIVVQNQGALGNAIGSGSLVPLRDSLPCSGESIPFAVRVPVEIPRNGTFEEGPAEARVSALATGDPKGSDTQSVDTTLELVPQSSLPD